jgi:type IV pilus assembly protein PilA
MKLTTKRRSDDGFTLIELMVVVLVIAILLAIAIPTFLGARKRAQDSVAKTSLRNALSAANVLYTDAQTFAAADENATTGMPSVEPSLTYVATGTASASPKSISVAASAGQWSAAAKSDSAQCFTIRVTAATGATTYAKFDSAAGGAPACSGTTANAASGTGAAIGASW